MWCNVSTLPELLERRDVTYGAIFIAYMCAAVGNAAMHVLTLATAL